MPKHKIAKITDKVAKVAIKGAKLYYDKIYHC